MTNNMEEALHSAAEALLTIADEVKKMEADINDLRAMVHKHEGLNNELANLFKRFA